MKTSKISIFKDHCKHIAGLCSSTIIIATKPAHDKLPLSTISYPYQQLVTILTKKTEAGIFKNFIAIAFKKISYPLSTISYPYQQLVTLHPHLVTLFSIHNRIFKVLANKKYCYTARVLSNNLINKIYASYTSSTFSYTYQYLVTLHPHLVTLLPTFSYTSSTFSYTCYSKTPTTMGKTYFLLKLLKTLYKNRLKVRGCYE